MRTRHLALRTEYAYLQWMRRYVKFHGRRHARDLGPAEVEAFLTQLAVASKVSASTQNQALQALLFLYRQVMGIELPWLKNAPWQRPAPDGGASAARQGSSARARRGPGARCQGGQGSGDRVACDANRAASRSPLETI